MDLATVTTDELLDELIRRHDVAVFVGRPKANRDYQWQIRSTGAAHEAMGLTCLAQFSLSKNAFDNTKNVYGDTDS